MQNHPNLINIFYCCAWSGEKFVGAIDMTQLIPNSLEAP